MQTYVVKRTGEIVAFDIERIRKAIAKALQATGTELSEDKLDAIVASVRDEISERFLDFHPNVENIQDIVEKHLVKEGLYEVAKAYILYRAQHQKDREDLRRQDIKRTFLGKLAIRKRDGTSVLFDMGKLARTINRACESVPDISADLLVTETIKTVYEGMPTTEIEKTIAMAASSFIERDPGYGIVAARLLLQKIRKEAIGRSTDKAGLAAAYRETFISAIKRGVETGLLDSRLLSFDLEELSARLDPDRDSLLTDISLQTLYERYFLKIGDRRVELPQAFWMRVAMGLAINDQQKSASVTEFYDVMSSLRFVPSTPTLFHAGTARPQLSSCYLTTIADDLGNIFKSLSDNAQLSKWSGGLGNDWTNVRATGARIQSTNVESQGVIPFLKIANDVTVAINRSGKRRGATCAYLECWHLDFEDFLDLRKNTGDERRRTHDMDTAAWIPDLFMKRVQKGQDWTLFSPDEVGDLHDLYGKRFEERYQQYEDMAREGKIRNVKTIAAEKLWRRMLGMLFETGHPWITFKDPSNIRSPQDHVGVVHSSNLCTEITLNTSSSETAVCNLGSINLARHIVDGALDGTMLARSVRTAIRMLDNVIDINYYPTEEAKASNMRHRPIGLGIMGFQDVLFALRISFDSPSAIRFADESMELIAYHAIMASANLAKERGSYQSFAGSKWDRGIFPIDTLDLLEEERDVPIDVPRKGKLDWSPVRDAVRRYGMRNSNTMAIAPTATISNIAGCFPSIEPIYKNIYVKANISGEFTVVNNYLVADLKTHGLWSEGMLEQLKYHDGSVRTIAAIPADMKELYREAFETDASQLIRIAAARGKWIDQSQSLNLFVAGTSGQQLSDIYMLAWRLGLKTTYYLRTLAASQIEKATLAPSFGLTQKREMPKIHVSDAVCEACQ